jgi:hypothetical protein
MKITQDVRDYADKLNEKQEGMEEMAGKCPDDPPPCARTEHGIHRDRDAVRVQDTLEQGTFQDAVCIEWAPADFGGFSGTAGLFLPGHDTGIGGHAVGVGPASGHPHSAFGRDGWKHLSMHGAI